MRIKLLKSHYYWDAFLLDLEKEIKQIPKSSLNSKIRKITKYYLAIYVYLTHKIDKLDDAIEIIHKNTRFKITIEEKKKIQYQLYNINKRIGLNNLILEPTEKTITLYEILPELELTVKVSQNIANQFLESLNKKKQQKKAIRHIDNLTLAILEKEYKRTRLYSKQMNLKFVSYQVAKKTNINTNIIYREIKRRIYHKFIYKYLRKPKTPKDLNESKQNQA